MFVEKLKEKILAATKARSSSELSILKLALGEIQTAEARRKTNPLTQDECFVIIRKIVKSNDDSIASLEKFMQDGFADPRIDLLRIENSILSNLLPKVLSLDEVRIILKEDIESIKDARSDGQAMGIAMKLIKTAQVQANAADVGKLLMEIRYPKKDE